MRQILIAATAALALTGCSTGTTQGDRALVGTGLGAATGAVIGGLATGRTSGAVVGALIGGATGAVVGASTTPQCGLYDARTRQPLYDEYGRQRTAPCP